MLMYYGFDRETKKTYVIKDANGLIEWSKANDSSIKRTVVSNEIEVSTVFLPIDHNFSGIGEPLLFETMIFGGERDLECRRWSSYQEAIAGHDEVVRSFSTRCTYCGTLRTADEVKCPSCGGSF